MLERRDTAGDQMKKEAWQGEWEETGEIVLRKEELSI